MRTRYTSLIAIAFAASAVAQPGNFTTRSFNKGFNPGTMAGTIHPSGHAAVGGSGERDAFFSEDFSGGGIPAGWTTADDMTPIGQTPVLFQWSNDPTSVSTAAVNQPLILTFNAPGASNGYVWANSDRGLTSAPASNHLARLTTNAIDCSGRSSVLLTMQSTIGVFDLDASTNCKIRVSPDGTTWTDFAPFPCLTAGDINPPCERFSYNPQSVAVDITSAAAGQATVYLQFQWQGGWEYYWAIDDLQLSAFPEYELVMTHGSISQFGDGTQYGRILRGQLPAAVNVGAEVVNFGSFDQTNVTVNASLMSPDGIEVGTATSTIPLMLHGDTVVTNAFITMPANAAYGTYTAHFTVTSDQVDLDENLANNSAYRYFAITTELYGLDGIGILPDSVLSLSTVGTTSFLNNTEDVRLLNYFEVPQSNIFIGVEVVLGANTQVGSYFIAAVYDTADVRIGQNPTALMESDARVVTQQDLDLGGLAEAGFLAPIILGPGAYYVSANLYQEAGQNISISDDVTVSQPAGASLIYLPVDDQNRYVYGNGNAWAVRLIQFYRPNVIDEQSGLDGVSLYPNPTIGRLEIHTRTTGTKSVEVFNALGAKVLSDGFSGLCTSVDLTGHAAGIYSIRISDGINNSVQRIALQ